MANAIDAEDAINKDLDQLHAMLVAVHGGGIDHFSIMNKQLQDAYLCIKSGRRRIVSDAIKGLGLRTSARTLLALPATTRRDFAQWLVVSFPGGGEQRELVQKLAQAIAPTAHRPSWISFGIIRAAQQGRLPAYLDRRLTKSGKRRRGRPSLMAAGDKAAYVGAIDTEVARQSRLVRRGNRQPLSVAIEAYLRSCGTDPKPANVEQHRKRYSRWGGKS